MADGSPNSIQPPKAGEVWQVDPTGIGSWVDPNASAQSRLFNYVGQTANANATNEDTDQLEQQGLLQKDESGSWALGPNAPKSLNTMFRPQGISGADHAINPSMVQSTPYGNITDTRNIYHAGEHDFMEKYGQPAMEMALSLGMGGAIGAVDPEMLGGGFTGGAEGLDAADPTKWMGIGQKAQGMLGGDNGPSFNPSSLFGGALGMAGGALNIPPAAMQFLPAVMSMAQGHGMNPIQLMMMLARSRMGGGNG